MKIEEKIKYILDAYKVEKEKYKRWYKAELHGTRILFYRLEELIKNGFEILDIEIITKAFMDQYDYPDSYTTIFVRIIKKSESKEGEKYV